MNRTEQEISMGWLASSQLIEGYASGASRPDIQQWVRSQINLAADQQFKVLALNEVIEVLSDPSPDLGTKIACRASEFSFHSTQDRSALNSGEAYKAWLWRTIALMLS